MGAIADQRAATPAAMPFLAPAQSRTLTQIGTGGTSSAHVSAVDVRYFGAVMRSFDARVTRTEGEANRRALNTAIAWSAATGGVVHIPGGSLDIWGEAPLLLGAAIRGQGKHNSRIRQLCQPTRPNEPFTSVLPAPPLVGGAGGNGFNMLADLMIDGGWNMRGHIGHAEPNWTYDPARMTQVGIGFNTPLGGPAASASRMAGSDAHGRLDNVTIMNVAGYGFRLEGRGENFVRGVEISRCHTGFYHAAPDCFFSDMTVYLCGDNGAEIRASAGNFRWTNSKLWFCGAMRGTEGRGAGIYLPDSGTQTMQMRNISTQDTWGSGLDLQGDVGIIFEGEIDEAGGGRLTQQGMGYAGTRSLPRAFIRLPGTLRRAKIRAEIKGGDRNGVANRPYLVDLRGSGVLGSRLKLGGSLDGVHPDRVLVSTGHGNAGRYNEIWFEGRLLHGHVTQAQLDDPAHGVNDPIYGPSRVLREDGALIARAAAGGWRLPPV